MASWGGGSAQWHLLHHGGGGGGGGAQAHNVINFILYSIHVCMGTDATINSVHDTKIVCIIIIIICNLLLFKYNINRCHITHSITYTQVNFYFESLIEIFPM